MAECNQLTSLPCKGFKLCEVRTQTVVKSTISSTRTLDRITSSVKQRIAYRYSVLSSGVGQLRSRPSISQTRPWRQTDFSAASAAEEHESFSFLNV